MGARWVYMLPALLLSVLAIILAIAGLSREPATVEVPVAATDGVGSRESDIKHHYWVARRNIASGTELNEELLRPIGVAEPLSQALPKDRRMAGLTLRRPVREGEILSQFHLQPTSELAQTVPAGTRAIAVSINDVSALGGLMQAGDLVDILAHFSRAPGSDQPTVLFLLNDIEVLAVYGRLQDQPTDDDQRRNRNATAVLAIPREDLPKLLLADTNGALRLALAGAVEEGDAIAESSSEMTLSEGETTDVAEDTPRQTLAALAPADDDEKDKPVKLEDLFPKPEPPPAQRPAARPRGHQVEIFEGSRARSTHVQ